MPTPTVTPLGGGTQGANLTLPAFAAGEWLVIISANNQLSSASWSTSASGADSGPFGMSTGAADFVNAEVRVDVGIHKFASGIASGKTVTGPGAYVCYKISPDDSGYGLGFFTVSGFGAVDDIPGPNPAGNLDALPRLLFGFVAGSDRKITGGHPSPDPNSAITFPTSGAQGQQYDYNANLSVDVAAAYDLEESSLGPYQTTGSFSKASDYGDGCAGLFYLKYTADPKGDIALAQSPDTGAIGRLNSIDGGAHFQRYDDAYPPSPGTATDFESASTGCTGVSLLAREEGIWDAFYCKAGDVKYQISRDDGKTWSVVGTIASGYQDIKTFADEEGGHCYAFLLDQAAKKIYLTVGTVQSDGTFGGWITPVDVGLTSIDPGMDILMTEPGIFMLSHRAGSTLTDTYYRAILADGSRI